MWVCMWVRIQAWSRFYTTGGYPDAGMSPVTNALGCTLKGLDHRQLLTCQV